MKGKISQKMIEKINGETDQKKREQKRKSDSTLSRMFLSLLP
jgi:hypothetical protein